jgi:hypothetical protein
VQLYLDRGDLQGCEVTVSDMAAAAVPCSAITFCQRLRMCCLDPSPDSGKAKAAHLWAEMTATGVLATTDCYNAMLTVSLRGDVDCITHAMQVVREMRQRELLVMTDTFNTIMTASVGNGNFLQVWQLRAATPGSLLSLPLLSNPSPRPSVVHPLEVPSPRGLHSR